MSMLTDVADVTLFFQLVFVWQYDVLVTFDVQTE